VLHLLLVPNLVLFGLLFPLASFLLRKVLKLLGQKSSNAEKRKE
jgi:hypothetical protein